MSIVEIYKEDYTDPFSGGVLVEMNDDDFLNMAIHIYETYGFGKLGKYYSIIRIMSDKLIRKFQELYSYFDNEDTENIKKTIAEFSIIKRDFLHNIIDIDKMLMNNKTFIKILYYFDDINIKDLDHRENGDCIISFIHMEWLKRIDNIGCYYQSISDAIDTKITKSKSRGIMGYIRKALTSSSNDTDCKSVIQSYKQIDSPIKKNYVDESDDFTMSLNNDAIHKSKISRFCKLKIAFACFIFSIRLCFNEFCFTFSHYCGMINNNLPIVYPQIIETYNNETYWKNYLT